MLKKIYIYICVNQMCFKVQKHNLVIHSLLVTPSPRIGIQRAVIGHVQGWTLRPVPIAGEEDRYNITLLFTFWKYPNQTVASKMAFGGFLIRTTLEIFPLCEMKYVWKWIFISFKECFRPISYWMSSILRKEILILIFVEYQSFVFVWTYD